MSRRLLHISSINRTAIWSDFTHRSPSLGIQSPKIKQTILNGGEANNGPSSIKRRFNRLKYQSPEHIDETFQTCYEFLEGKSESIYKTAEKYNKLPNVAEKLLVKAEINNPEVQYNFKFNEKVNNIPSVIDYNQPVYRYLGKKHWESYKQMLLMQRLESLAVIPDTLPTLVPRAAVEFKFPFSTGINQWIEPGMSLSSNVTSMEPVFKVQEYDIVNPKEQLYTILIVNPDEPDLINNSFRTTLNYGLTNLKIDYNDNLIDSRKFFERNILAKYIPPVPEKNAGNQRFCIWVFRQNMNKETGKCEVIDNESLKSQIDRDNFSIRKFTEEHKLNPIGAQVWRSTWDNNVNKVRELNSLPAGRVFSKVRTSALIA